MCYLKALLNIQINVEFFELFPNVIVLYQKILFVYFQILDFF